MRKHWLTVLAIGVSLVACDEAVNVNCGEHECQFADSQFADEECHDGEIRCASGNKGYLKCIDNHWNDFELCEDDKICDDALGKCVDGCEDKAMECIDDSTTSYRICENKDWVFKECDSGKICKNNQCIAPEVPEECQADAFECTDESNYRKCVKNNWVYDNCEEGKICQENACIPQPPPNCEGSVFECTDKFNYRKCVENKWVNEKCEDGKVCQNNACVPPEPSDCNEGKFLGCTQDKTQKQIQICNPQNVKNEPCDPGMICDPQSEGCINIPAPPSDPCSYEKIKDELTDPNLGCDDTSKTFIISSSTNLSQLNNWHDNEKKSCLVFCGDIALEGLTDSIPLPPNAKVVGVKEANLSAEEVKEAKLIADELSKPLFKGKDGESITSTTFKNLDIAVEKMLISNNGAHAVLANNAKDVTVENVSLTGKLEHNDNTTIQEVGCLFGKTKGKSTIQNTTLNDATIVLNSIPNYDESGNYNRCVGGFVGESSDVLTITTPKINGLTINANYARHVGGLVGNSGSKTKISGSYHFDQSKINYDISSYDVSNLTISNVIHYAGGLVGKAENASLTIENMAIQINTIQAYVYCAAGIIGHVRGSESELTIQNSYLKVSEQIKSGSYAGGVAAYLIDLRKMNMENLIVKIKNIDTIKQSEFKYDDQNDRNGLDENKAGGLIGTIESLNSEGIMNHIYLIVDHIKANKYAGGYIGRIKEGKGNNIKLLNNSNVIKEVLANENSGGLIGFVEKNNTINIEKLQNIVLTLKTTKASTYPGGVVGRISSDASIDNIKLKTVISYSQRFQNNVRRHEGALISSTQCKNENGPFTNSLYINDILVDDDYNATACINGISGNTTGRLRRIWTEDECKDSKADGFTCTKVKVKDSKAPITIPLFDTSMLDEDGNIQW